METHNLNLPFLTRFKLFLLHFLRRLSTLLNLPPDRLLDFKSPPTASSSDITVDASRNLWFRLFRPTSASASALPLPLIVYFHGGGFASYAANSSIYHHLCNTISAKVPAVVASVNYRLAPQHRYPVQYDDCFDAFKFIVDYLPDHINRCVLAGDSAGGNIAHHVAVRAASDRIKLRGLVLLQPFFGGEERTQSEMRLMRAPVLDVERTDWFWACFLPQGANRNHPAARVFDGGMDLAEVELPRVLVVQGAFDPLKDWQERYIEWLKDSGKQVESIEYPNAFHGFYAFPELPEFDLCITLVSDFIRSTTVL